MSRVLSYFSRLMNFFQPSVSGGAVLAEPPSQIPAQVPVARTDVARAAPDQIVKRDELRARIRALGTEPTEFESMHGDCPTQVETQIDQYVEWLRRNG